MSHPSRRPATPASPTSASPTRRSLGTRLRDAVRVWAVPALLVVSVQTLIGQTYHIPSGSMEPTMLVGDWLVVNKLAYGAHIPFSDVSLPGYDDPSRGAGDYTDAAFEWQSAYAVRASRFGEPPVTPSLDNWGPIRVPEGMLFLLGDHRHASKDSRFWGFAPRANVRGRPVFVYYSYNATDSDRAWPALTDIRWGRIGHLYR